MKNIVLIIILFSLNSCTSKTISKSNTEDKDIKRCNFSSESGVDEYGNYYGDITIHKDKKEINVGFSIFKNEANDLFVSIPENWNIKPDEGVFYAEFGMDKKDFFMIQKYNQDEVRISFDEYIKLLKKSFINDSTVVYSEMKVEKLYDKYNEILFIKANMSENDNDFHFCSYYINNQKTYFEITIKYKNGNVDDYVEQLFDLAAYSLIYEEKRLMEGMQFPRIAIDFGDLGN
ncbi:MAG: hypothetical protein ACJATI_005041 [Halioglobus sp.]|jgi:hypothetical protein